MAMTTIKTIPKMDVLAGGGNFYGGMAGLVVINFNPVGPDAEAYVKNLPDGTIIISLGIFDKDTCTTECDVRLYVKGCSTCDTPVLLEITTEVAVP